MVFMQEFLNNEIFMLREVSKNRCPAKKKSTCFDNQCHVWYQKTTLECKPIRLQRQTSKLSRTQKPFTPPIVAHDPVDSKKTASDSIHAFFVQYFLMEEIRLTSQYGKYPIIHLQGFIHPRWLLLRISHVSYDFIHPRM